MVIGAVPSGTSKNVARNSAEVGPELRIICTWPYPRSMMHPLDAANVRRAFRKVADVPHGGSSSLHHGVTPSNVSYSRQCPDKWVGEPTRVLRLSPAELSPRCCRRQVSLGIGWPDNA
jgi:hypothetical protein